MQNKRSIYHQYCLRLETENNIGEIEGLHSTFLTAHVVHLIPQFYLTDTHAEREYLPKGSACYCVPL